MLELSFLIILAIILIILTFLGGIFVFVTFFSDAPYVPTPLYAVHKILKVAEIKKGDKLYDLGAGDGRFLHFAEKDYGAKAKGFEINYPVYLIGQFKRKFMNWRGELILGNFFKQSLKNADIIIFYFLPNGLKKFREKYFKNLKKGTKIISYAFEIPGLKAKKIIPRKDGVSRIFIYQI